MGFPKLTQDLAAYAEYLQLGHNLEESHAGSSFVERWVIDGPSLIYHAYDNLLANRASLAATADSILPTYNEVNHAVTAFLPALEKHGIYITAIFFDGSLPAIKRAVRLERLEKTREQLEKYRHQASGRPGHLPPLPFLVASAIESLRTTCWADRVHVVSEEADIACARVASFDAPVSILTNDSDLALFRMPAETRIVWLHSLIEKGQQDGSPFLQASCLIPSATASRLGIPSLLQIGFERHRDSSVTTGTILQRARNSPQNDLDSHEYAKFCKQYSITSNTGPSIELSGCDPRVAEFIVQAHTSQQCRQIYLPVLHEDPSRDASWVYGVDVRQLAYSIFHRACPIASYEITEYYRKGYRIAASSVQILSASNTIAAVTFLLATLTSFLRSNSGEGDRIYSAVAWWALASSMLARLKVARARALDMATVRTLFGLEKQRSQHVSWDSMHLHANLQAVLYSLRMLKQIVAYTQRQDGSSASEAPELSQLAIVLESMPTIESLFLDVRQLRELVAEIGVDKAKAILQPVDAMDRGEVVEHCLHSQENSTIKAEKRKSKVSLNRPVRCKPQNSFGILADVNENDE